MDMTKALEATAGEEVCAFRFVGGPWAGETRLAKIVWPPLEDIAGMRTGFYHRTGMSELDGPVPHVMRGAEYHWRQTGVHG